MVDVVESMLRMFLEALQNDDRKLLNRLAAMDDTLDNLYNAVKLHLTAISREDGLSEADAKRCSDILAFTINLEHIGDILDKSLREIVRQDQAAAQLLARRSAGNRQYAPRPARQLHLATSVFMLGDHHSARALLVEKDRMRDLEQAATENHLRRLREGRSQSIETSSLHIDIARDLKRIAAHIASVAYPILEQSGSLRRSRLMGENESADESPNGGQGSRIRIAHHGNDAPPLRAATTIEGRGARRSSWRLERVHPDWPAGWDFRSASFRSPTVRCCGELTAV